MEVTLTPEMETWVREKIESGRFHSASQAVSEALQRLKETDEKPRRCTARRSRPRSPRA